MRSLFSNFAPPAQNRQETNEASPMILSSHTDRAGTTSLLCDARSQPTGEDEEDGSLFN